MTMRLATLLTLFFTLWGPVPQALATQGAANGGETGAGEGEDQGNARPEEGEDPVPPQVWATLEPGEAKIGEKVHYTVLIGHDGTKLFHLAANPGTGRLTITGKSHVTTTAGALAREASPEKQSGTSPRDTKGLNTGERGSAGRPGLFSPKRSRKPELTFPLHQDLAEQAAALEPGAAVEVFQFTMTAWRPGKAELGHFPIQYLDQSGREFTVGAPGGTINFKSVLSTQSMPGLIPPETGGPVHVPVWWPVWLALGLAGAALVAGGAFALGRKLKNRKRETPAPPQVPAHETALSRLDTLAGERLAEKGEFKEFCLQLSEIIREYLGARYGFDSLELTSTELLGALNAKGREAGAKGEGDQLPDQATVEQFLENTDMVKFAKYIPTMTEMDQFWGAARTIVATTIPAYSATREPEASPAGESPEPKDAALAHPPHTEQGGAP